MQTELDNKTVEILTIKKLMQERDEAKIASNFVKSDYLRDQLVKEYNIDIFDQKNGPSGWKYKDGKSKKLPNGLIIPDNLKVKRARDDDAGRNGNNTNDRASNLSKKLKKTANDDNIDKTITSKQCSLYVSLMYIM